MADDHDRPMPPPVPPHLVPNNKQPEYWEQAARPKAPVRALKIVGNDLKASVRSGRQIDWADLHDRYVDLWKEARLALWRAKHSKLGTHIYDEAKKKTVTNFVVDEKLVLEAINVTKGVLDSIVKIRREIGHENTGIPRWAIERIERALRQHPEALNALLKELASENEKPAEVTE